MSRAETRPNGPIPVYTVTPNATAGLKLGISSTGEKRFEITAKYAGELPMDEYFWIVFTEIHPAAVSHVAGLYEKAEYLLGTAVYSGVPGERYVAIPVRRLDY
jgi:hypothetical protein